MGRNKRGTGIDWQRRMKYCRISPEYWKMFNNQFELYRKHALGISRYKARCAVYYLFGIGEY